MSEPSGDQRSLPSISFIVPTRDEESHIATCIESLLGQDYPPELIEVLVVDGRSADRTREIVGSYCASDPRVHLLDNPKRTTPVAFNLGMAAAESDVLSIVSAHSRTDKGFARLVASIFESTDAELIGGMSVAVPGTDTSTARGICRAMGSPFGLGNARYHYAETPGWVDTAYPSAYRRTLVDKIGYFDEELIRNQDDDYHLRASQAGLRMWYDPRLRAEYFSRKTYAALWRQFFDYGYWRAFTAAKHRAVAAPRHLVPGLLVLWLGALPLALPSRVLQRVWGGGVAAYAGFLVFAGAREARQTAPKDVPRFVAAIAVMHTSYGSGFWKGAAQVARTARHRA